ncbi:MAG: hypothetical protein IJL17_02180 [Kiritimatiellae bacterium]|nr:hypothetical protein [Kiritimatiellia bacterium]
MASSKTYNHAYLLDGREWGDEAGKGMSSVSARYLVILDSPLDDDALLDNVSGLPKLGDAHETFENLIVKSRRFSEGKGSEKTRVEVTVEYGPQTNQDEEDEHEVATLSVEKIGWQSGSVQRDLTNDVETGAPVLNSANQPFESVPQVDRPAPTYVKVFKTKTRWASYVTYVDKVNSGTLSVGGHTFAADQVRCSQADEERIFGDPDGWMYRYTIALQIMSNKVKINGSDSMRECGWQVPVVDCGTVQLSQGSDQEVERITVATDSGKSVPVSSPVLLDGSGHFDPAQTDPYVFLVVAYERVSFPSAFTSEPA